MDYTSYEDSLAAINGLPVDLESKPATDFATYIQTLLDNPAPRGFMLSGRAPATAEEELELKKAEEVIKKLVPDLAGPDGYVSENKGTPFSMGKGKATDAIVSNAIQAAVRGLAKGGLTGAVIDGLFSYGSGMMGLADQINNTPDGDVLGAWGRAQMGYPAPVVNLSSPSTMFSDPNTSTIADGGYQGPTSSGKGPVGGVTVGGPITGEVDFSVEDSGGGSSSPATAAEAGYSGDFM
jgi:hypothetical protein